MDTYAIYIVDEIYTKQYHDGIGYLRGPGMDSQSMDDLRARTI